MEQEQKNQPTQDSTQAVESKDSTQFAKFRYEVLLDACIETFTLVSSNVPSNHKPMIEAHVEKLKEMRKAL